jgi:hypothetical protein
MSDEHNEVPETPVDWSQYDNNTVLPEQLWRRWMREGRPKLGGNKPDEAALGEMARNFERAHPQQPEDEEAIAAAWQQWFDRRIDPVTQAMSEAVNERVAAMAKKLRLENEELRRQIERNFEREIASAVREVRSSVRGLVQKQLIDLKLLTVTRGKDAVTKAGR